jgi:hypothetical protein
MRYIRKFESFRTNEEAGQPMTKPAPSTTPTTTPGQKPGKKGRPSPIRKDKPAVTPDPKAEKTDMKKATAEDVISKYEDLTK